jgi:hypothetical protein
MIFRQWNNDDKINKKFIVYKTIMTTCKINWFNNLDYGNVEIKC